MVNQQIKDIDIKKLKSAKGVMAVFELLGLNEDDFMLLKQIPSILEELKELREFKAQVLRTMDVKSEGKRPVSQVVSDVYGKPTKEFNPHYE